jgi:hypothetical protein
MNSPDPVPPTPAPSQPPAPAPAPAPGALPSNSTNATALGGAAAALVIGYLGTRGVTFPAGYEAALAVIFATLAGYLPKSGRR